jgi:hypothetical protein
MPRRQAPNDKPAASTEQASEEQAPPPTLASSNFKIRLVDTPLS